MSEQLKAYVYKFVKEEAGSSVAKKLLKKFTGVDTVAAGLEDNLMDIVTFKQKSKAPSSSSSSSSSDSGSDSESEADKPQVKRSKTDASDDSSSSSAPSPKKASTPKKVDTPKAEATPAPAKTEEKNDWNSKPAWGGGKGGGKGGDREWVSDEDWRRMQNEKQVFIKDVPQDCENKDVETALGAHCSYVERCKWLDKEGWSGKGFITVDSKENAIKIGEVGTVNIKGVDCEISWCGNHTSGGGSGGNKGEGGKKGGGKGKGGKKGGKDGKKGGKGGKKGKKSGPPSTNKATFTMDTMANNKQTFADSDSE